MDLAGPTLLVGRGVKPRPGRPHMEFGRVHMGGLALRAFGYRIHVGPGLEPRPTSVHNREP